MGTRAAYSTKVGTAHGTRGYASALVRLADVLPRRAPLPVGLPFDSARGSNRARTRRPGFLPNCPGAISPAARRSQDGQTDPDLARHRAATGERSKRPGSPPTH